MLRSFTLRARPHSAPKASCLLLVVVACGAPAELDEGRFPRPDATGYVNGQTSAGNAPNNGGAPAIGQGGGTGVGTGGSAAPQGGSGGAPPVGSGDTSGGSSSQAGSTQNGGSTSGAPNSDGCPDDITVLFARPISEGGCTNNGGCHEAGGQIAPDLVSPNVEARLLNVASSCSTAASGASVGPRPFISAGDSYLTEKIGSPPASCGFAMPFLEPQNLSAADEQCINDWIAEVAGGGG